MGTSDALAELRARIRSIESGASKGHSERRYGETLTFESHASVGSCDGPAALASEPEPDEVSKALKRILALVNVSEKSSVQVRRKLESLDFEQDVIEEALSRAVSYGYVSDERFACSLVRSRLSQGRGEDGIRRELLEHGIEIDDVPGWPYDFDFDSSDEAARAYDFICKHPSRSKNAREGAYRKLVQKGYNSSAASEAARKWAAEQ